MHNVVEYLKTFRGRMVVAITIVALGCSIGIYQTRQLAANIQREGKDRRNQQCTILERQYAQTVKQLEGTYKYLEALTPQEAKTTLNQFVIRNQNDIETQARVTDVPKFCDEKGVGLPEPNPTLPPRRDFSYLLIRSASNNSYLTNKI